MATVFHVRPYGEFIERERKKLHEEETFLEGGFVNRNNVRAPI